MVFGIVGCASNQSILSNETLERLSKERQESALRDIEKDKEEVRATKEKISNMSDEEKIRIAKEAREERLKYEKEREAHSEKVLQEERLAEQRALKIEVEWKKKILSDLKIRCEEYGFTGESNISACIQREAQHDKELAMQRLELQRTYAQNLTEPVQEEEDLPFLVKFLGDVAIGVAENLADPAFQRDMQQQRQINELKANQNRDIYRDCRPNC